MQIELSRSGRLSGSIRPPSDKSLTHRALMFGALARTPSVVRQALEGEDCQATMRCLRKLGHGFEQAGPQEIRISPSAQWIENPGTLDCGNSGTTIRLLSGIIAGRWIKAQLTGDASLTRRPMRRIIDPLRQMGATITGDTPPIEIFGGGLTGISYQSPIASAQVKSCLLLAGLEASGRTEVTEPALSRDHTEQMLAALGVPIQRSHHEDGPHTVSVPGGAEFDGFEFTVPGDISSAAFWMVAAALVPGSEVELLDVGINPTRTGIFHPLRQCRASFEFDELGTPRLGEPVAHVRCRATKDALQPFRIGGPTIPKLIDEIPILAVLATQCEGTSVIENAEDLRAKESDRLKTMAAGLSQMGANIEETEDGLRITGPTRLKGITIDAHGDHRIAMSFAIAALIAEGPTTITGAETIATSYPTFLEDLKSLTS